MKMFRCDVCGTRLNSGNDCYVKLMAYSKRVDDGWDDKKLKVSEQYEVCPDCWERFEEAFSGVLEEMGGKL